VTHFTCACGAQRSTVEITEMADLSPTFMPGSLLEPCTCPRCIGCHQLLDKDQRCDNLDCRYCGLLIVVPD
jgi:hypothetical protein